MFDPRACDPNRSDKSHSDLSYLLFRDGTGLLRFIPLADVERIELVAPNRVEMVAGHPVICSHGHCIPLETVAGGGAFTRLPVLIFRQQGREMGLVVRKTSDIVHGKGALAATQARAFDPAPYINHALTMMPEISRCPHGCGASLRGWTASMLAAARQLFNPPRVHASH